MGEKFVDGEETYSILGACFQVYRELGSGFLESVYQECLERELKARGISFVSHPELRILYMGEPLESKFIPDLVCYCRVVVELKAVAVLIDEHRAQLHNYLKASGRRVGLLVNFGHYPKLEVERIIR